MISSRKSKNRAGHLVAHWLLEKIANDVATHLEMITEWSV